MLLHSTLEQAEATERLGQTLNLTSQEVQRLNYAAEAAHVGSEALSTGLMKMEKTIGAAAIKGSEASGIFSEIGLDLAKLANESASDAFKDISEALSNVGNTSERAAATVAIFGKSGQELIPVLARGRQGLEDAAAAADKTHFALSGVENHQLVEAAEAMNRLRLQSLGTANVLTAALSPYLAEAAGKLEELRSSGSLTTEGLQHGFETVVEMGAPVLSILQGMDVGLYDIDEALLTIGGALLTIFDAVPAFLNFITGGLIPGLDKFVEKMHDTHDLLSAMHDDLEGHRQALDKADWAGEALKAAKAVGEHKKEVDQLSDGYANAAAMANELGKGIDTVAKGPAEQLAALIKQSNEHLATVQAGSGHSELAKAQMEYAEAEAAARERMRQGGYLAGADFAEQAKLKALRDQVAQVKALEDQTNAVIEAERKQKEEEREQVRIQNQIAEAGRRMTEDNLTPIEKYNEGLAEANDLLEKGAINADTYGRQRQKLQDELDKADDKKDAMGLGDHHKTAAETVSVAYRVGDSFADPMDKLVDQGKQQLQKVDKTNEALASIANTLAESCVVTMSI
jgi:hypothetical protein